MTSKKESNKPAKEKPQEEWFGGYKGGLLRWSTLKKKGRYTRRYNNKDIEMMRRILSTRIPN
jgi:hypothetical protein